MLPFATRRKLAVPFTAKCKGRPDASGMVSSVSRKWMFLVTSMSSPLAKEARIFFGLRALICSANSSLFLNVFRRRSLPNTYNKEQQKCGVRLSAVQCRAYFV